MNVLQTSIGLFNRSTFTTAFSRSMTATYYNTTLSIMTQELKRHWPDEHLHRALLLSPQISFSSVNLSHCLATNLSVSDSFTTMALYKYIYLLKNSPYRNLNFFSGEGTYLHWEGTLLRPHPPRRLRHGLDAFGSNEAPDNDTCITNTIQRMMLLLQQ